MASIATSNPESHSYLSLVDVVTVTFNMAVTKKTVVLAGLHVHQTFNGARRAALGAIAEDGNYKKQTLCITLCFMERKLET